MIIIYRLGPGGWYIRELKWTPDYFAEKDWFPNECIWIVPNN